MRKFNFVILIFLLAVTTSLFSQINIFQQQTKSEPLYTILDYLSKVASIVGGFGVPVTLYIYFRSLRKEKKKERDEKENLLVKEQKERKDLMEKEEKERKQMQMQKFNSLTLLWGDFLKICIDYPDLNIYNVTKNIYKLNKQQETMCEIMISMFESAYLQYNLDKEILEDQWSGWDRYIKDYLQIKAFRNYFKETVKYYSKSFENYITKEIEIIERA